MQVWDLVILHVEYDQFLEEQKDELATKNLVNCDDILETRKIEREIDQADQEVHSPVTH